MGMTVSVVYQSLVALVLLPMRWEYEFLGILYTPWRMYLLMSSVIMAIAFVVMMFLPESPKFLLAQGKDKEALEVLRTMYAINTGKPKEVIFDALGLLDQTFYVFISFLYSHIQLRTLNGKN